MLQLLLLRHAKSSWTDSSLDDADRPLTKRGKQAAKAMGREIAALGLAPDLGLCSPAKRARESWKIVSEELKTAPRMLVDDAIYDFGNGGRVLSVIKTRGNSANTLLVIGHNPSLERLAQRLAAAGCKKTRARLGQKFPTAALAVIGFDAISWENIEDGTGELIHFIRPSDIIAGD
jgi:phosphohistidine phosphatase